MTALLDAAAKTRLKKIISAIDGDNLSSVRFTNSLVSKPAVSSRTLDSKMIIG
jgi:hypothetical protein